jgi:hypothetical protein
MDGKEMAQINAKLDAILSATKTISKLAAMVEKHERILRGGNGEAIGLSARVNRAEELVCENHELLFGDGDKPGLKGNVQALSAKLQTLTDKFANYDKFVWFAVTAIIGTLISVWIR